MKYLLPGLIALSLLTVSCGVESELKDWQFSKDGQQWEAVTVPHSYNAQDGPTQNYYRGKAHYRREVSFPSGKNAFLLFEGAAQAAEVYLDGTLLKAHKGGYTPFVVPLPHGGQVEVVCDNTEDIEMIPVSSDFNKNGGLHNPVRLLVYDDVFFSPEEFGPYRLHVVQQEVTDNKVVAEVRTYMRNTGKDRSEEVTAVLKDAAGKVVAKETTRIDLPAGAGQAFATVLTLDNRIFGTVSWTRTSIRWKSRSARMWPAPRSASATSVSTRRKDSASTASLIRSGASPCTKTWPGRHQP